MSYLRSVPCPHGAATTGANPNHCPICDPPFEPGVEFAPSPKAKSEAPVVDIRTEADVDAILAAVSPTSEMAKMLLRHPGEPFRVVRATEVISEGEPWGIAAVRITEGPRWIVRLDLGLGIDVDFTPDRASALARDFLDLAERARVAALREAK